MDNSIDSAGTELFLSIDGTNLLKFDCPTAINGIGFTTNDIPNSCLDSITASSRPGQKTLSSISVPYNVQSGSEAHEYLQNLINNPTTQVPYAICLSDGTAPPTLVAGDIVPPGGVGTATRTTYYGEGFVSSNSVDINNGGIVTGTFTFSPQTQSFKAKV